MTRNVCQVLGRNGQDPVHAVLYWTPIPESGGTTQALRIARAKGIACLRIESDTDADELTRKINDLHKYDHREE